MIVKTRSGTSDNTDRPAPLERESTGKVPVARRLWPTAAVAVASTTARGVCNTQQLTLTAAETPAAAVSVIADLDLSSICENRNLHGDLQDRDRSITDNATKAGRYFNRSVRFLAR